MDTIIKKLAVQIIADLRHELLKNNLELQAAMSLKITKSEVCQMFEVQTRVYEQLHCYLSVLVEDYRETLAKFDELLFDRELNFMLFKMNINLITIPTES